MGLDQTTVAIKSYTSPCILTPLTVFVEGFLNFSPVAPGNWAVTDVSSIEPEQQTRCQMESQERLESQTREMIEIANKGK